MGSLRKVVKEDLVQYKRGSGWRSFFYVYWVFPGFRVTFWFRIARYLRVERQLILLGKLATFWLIRYQLKTGVTLNPGTEIGPGLYIPHPGCIVINPGCKVGSNVYISHDVLLGKAHSGPRMGVPEVGNRVFIGAGARLLGRLKVGDNAAIGANSVVLQDVPGNCFVAGVPAKVVKQAGADEILGRKADIRYESEPEQ